MAKEKIEEIPAKSIKSGLFYNGLYQVVYMIAPLITAPYIARTLGPNGIGLFNYISSIAFYFFIFAMLGVNTYGNREIAKVRNDIKKRSEVFWQIYYLQLALGLISLTAYIGFVNLTVESDRRYFMIMALYVASVCTDINWYAFGLEEFKIVAIRNIAVKVITTVCTFVFIKTANDLHIYFYIYTISVIIALLPIWVLVSKTAVFVKPDLRKILSHLQPNFTLFLPFIASSIYQYMDKIMLGAMVSKEEVGFYGYAESILSIPMGMTSVFMNVLLPRSSFLIEKGEVEQRNSIFNIIIRYSSLISIGIIFGILAVADLFIPWYLGDNYSYTALLLKVLTPVVLLNEIASNVRNQILIPERKDKEYTIAIFAGAIINIMLNFFFIKYWHAIGACITTIIAHCAVILVQSRYTKHVFILPSYLKKITPYVLNGLGMYLLVVLVSNLLPSLPIFPKLIILVITGIAYYMLSSILILTRIEKDNLMIEQLKRISRVRK